MDSENQDKYHYLFNNNPNPLLVISGEDAHILDVNEAAIDLYGYTREEFLTLNGKDLRPEEDTQLFREQRKLAMQQTRHSSMDFRHQKKDGTVFYVDVHVHRYKEEDKPVDLVLVHDVTLRKEAKKEVEYLKEFNKLLVNISNTFITARYTEIDDAVRLALKKVTDFTGFDRTVVYLLNEDKSEYSREGIPPLPEAARVFPDEPFQWWMKNMYEGEAIRVKSAAELPEEATNERQILGFNGICSVVCVPVSHRNELLGHASFLTVNEEKEWSDEGVEVLKLLGSMIGNTLYSAGLEKEKMQLLEEERSLSEALRNREEELKIQLTEINQLYEQLRVSEEESREANNRLSLATSTAGLGIWEANLLSGEVLFGIQYSSGPLNLQEVEKRFIHPDDREYINTAARPAVADGVPFTVEFRIIVNRQIKFVRMSAIALKDKNGVPVRLIGCNLDYTTTKEHELKLLENNKELAKANAELDHFVYSTSHNLRAPLASLMGLLEIIRYEPLSDEQLSHTALMEKSIRVLDETIHEIVNYSRNSRTSIQLQQFNLRQLVEDAVQRLTYLKEAREVAVETDIAGDLQVTADYHRIRVIFDNLISNALKYADQTKEQPRVRTTATLQDGQFQSNE
jgi:PAS domain S-box-containing protein